jgi:hypothetical protein
MEEGILRTLCTLCALCEIFFLFRTLSELRVRSLLFLLRSDSVISV